MLLFCNFTTKLATHTTVIEYCCIKINYQELYFSKAWDHSKLITILHANKEFQNIFLQTICIVYFNHLNFVTVTWSYFFFPFSAFLIRRQLRYIKSIAYITVFIQELL